MTAWWLLLTLSALLLLAALTGPAVLRKISPGLAAMPRLASATLAGAAMVWMTGLVFLGPLVAWMSAGPELLPHGATKICKRCLAAISPFGDSAITLAIPAFIPLMVPLVGIALVVVGLVREFVGLHRSTVRAVSHVASSAVATVHGHCVRLTDDDETAVYSLPGPRGGIVISRRTIDALTNGELAGVLAHERAHLSQRHHLFLCVLFGTTRYFRWVPLIAAIREVVPTYLEIAADQAAREVSGTPAIASALLKLGRLVEHGLNAAPAAPVALHAAGSERVRYLVGAPRERVASSLKVTLVAYAGLLLAAVAVVYWPYLVALVTGC